MKFSTRAKLALGAALLSTLGVKAAVSSPAPGVDAGLFTARASALVRAQGFDVRTDPRPFATLILARSGACRMIVAEYTPHGTMAEPLSALARSIGPLRYFWRGTLVEEPPKLVPLAAFFVQRELRRLGFRPQRQPIVAVAASPQCELRTVSWEALATLPG